MDTAIASSTASELSTDPVFSLRAAALSTLKAKRRKPPPDRIANLPARPPPPTDTLHLDYGADDGSQDVLMKGVPVLPDTATPPVEKILILPNQQAREEGEISEEDEPLPLKSSVKTPLATVSSTPKAITPEPRQGLEADRPRQTTPQRKDTTPVAKSVALPDSSRTSSSAIPRTSDAPMEGVILNEPNLVSSPLGLDYLRPGLQLTQHQYDTIKDIVLDLLGWGVPPAYLLDCGVSREAVFYVFSELNLELPEGFDTSGIISYLPDFSSQSRRPTVMPPPPLPDNRGIRSHPANHPIEVQPATKSSIPLDLHDIERQRRQELLARKAAQATRKIRQSTSLGSSNGSSTAKEVLTMTPASATEAVDDFLNSIGPVVDLGVNNRTKSISSDDMDVQDTPNAHDAEPHVRRLSSSSGSQSTPSQDTTSTVDSTALVTPAENQEVGLVANQPPPPSSSSSGFSQISDSDAIPTSPRLERSIVRSRRGMKRAVATDFDFDAAPRKAGSAYPPAKQPKTAFVTIASRRCVIDLSDSEAEDDPSRYARHTPGLDHLTTKNDWKGKPGATSSPNAKPSTPSGPLAPSALLQKELEIQKMRELIARREEETRLKKAAKAASSPSNDETPGPNIIQPKPIRLKVEETDVVMSAASPLIDSESELVARRSSESASPPGEISEASLPVTRSVTKSPIVKSSMQHGDQASTTTQETHVQPELSTNPRPFMFSMVDVDMFPSSSAEMNKSPTILSALPRLDGRKLPPPSEALFENPNHESQPNPDYIDYLSPFDLYPLLRSRPSISDFSSSLFMHTTSVTSDIHSSPAHLAPSWPSIGLSLVPDLKPLRLAVLSKRLDPSKRLCQYESGGGTCRDDKCEDLHLTRLDGMTASGFPEPTDKETADFLFSVLPHSWLSTYQVHSPDRILEALQEVQQQTTTDLADKVASAIALLMSFPPTSA